MIDSWNLVLPLKWSISLLACFSLLDYSAWRLWCHGIAGVGHCLVELYTWKGLSSTCYGTSRRTSFNLSTLSDVDVVDHALVGSTLVSHCHWLVILRSETIMPERAFCSLWSADSVQKPVLNISTTSFILGVELRNIILCGLRQWSSHVVHAILINNIGLELPSFGSVISNQHYFHVLRIRYSAAVIETVRIGVYFELLYAALAANFWRLLVMEAGAHHFAAYVLIWALVWVS